MGILDPLTRISTRRTAQTKRARADQVQNNAGGFVFAIDDWARLHRFLTLGTDSGTYYVAEQALTGDNAEVVLRLAASDPKRVVDEIVAISLAGRAPKQNPALFALAAVAGVADVEGRSYALTQLNRVARTGTQLALFANYVQQFRGWGRGLRRAIGNWYLDKTPDKLAYQVLKYRSREGWTPRDLLRKTHPVTDDPAKAALFDYITHGVVADQSSAPLPGLVDAFEEAKTASIPRIIELIGAQPLSWEMLPGEALGSADVWRALIEKGMPVTALLRQLPRLTRLDVLQGATLRQVTDRLQDPEALKRGRVHPINVLVALRSYASGRGARSSGSWSPIAQVVDALDAAFYTSFGTVQPAGKRTLLALDVSGSMTVPVSGLPLSCREASSALALVTAATEPEHEILGFTNGGRDALVGRSDQRWVGTGISRLSISPRQRLDDVLNYTAGLRFAGTDCALPMLWATAKQVPVDTFVVYTDSETWSGDIQPFQALRDYRDRMGIPAKLVVVAMAGTRFSIADPDDAGMLDVSGFDAAVPSLICDFSRGDI
jgi:60 kDa SS-A/Ro ribonucleoprotein